MDILKMVTSSRLILTFFSLFSFVLLASSPFNASLSVWTEGNLQYAELTIKGPSDGHIYAESLEIMTPEGVTVKQIEAPSSDSDGYYPANAAFKWTLEPPADVNDITGSFQGCVEDMCYMPQEVRATSTTISTEASTTDAFIPEGFRISEPLAGFHDANDFLNWIHDSLEGKTRQHNLLERVFVHRGWLLAGLLTIILGVLLNLTPCVLPMIPITLGVLGAKSAGHGRLHGALLGGCYGGAMALTYGLAGALVVAFGGRFGAINSSAIFQFVLAAIFIVLALAMFDCFLIDLSRYRTFAKFNCAAGSYGAAIFLGVLAALLAGACVAPVLIWVLILSARLFADGNPAALLLPLLLGIGLGLPWPLLGAGFGALPKPGMWMNYTKKAFGIIILLFAAYTVWNGIKLVNNSKQTNSIWRNDYSAVIAEATSDKKPILLDFWGISCKACDLMDAKTFRNPKVTERLKDIHCVAVQADAKENKPVVEAFGIKGMPTYYLLVPDDI